MSLIVKALITVFHDRFHVITVRKIQPVQHNSEKRKKAEREILRVDEINQLIFVLVAEVFVLDRRGIMIDFKDSLTEPVIFKIPYAVHCII